MVFSENRVPWQAVCEGAWLPLTLLLSLVTEPNHHTTIHYFDTLKGSKETTILRHNHAATAVALARFRDAFYVARFYERMQIRHRNHQQTNFLHVVISEDADKEDDLRVAWVCF